MAVTRDTFDVHADITFGEVVGARAFSIVRISNFNYYYIHRNSVEQNCLAAIFTRFVSKYLRFRVQVEVMQQNAAHIFNAEQIANYFPIIAINNSFRFNL